MPHEPVPPDAELSALEAALGSLFPARSRIDRDRVMFEAGAASVRPRSDGRRPWMALAASLAALALGEAVLLARPAPPRIVERIVTVPAPAPSPTPAPIADPPQPVDGEPIAGLASLGQTAQERLAGQVLRYGLDGLPAPPAASPRAGAERWQAPSRREMQNELWKTLDLDLGDAS